MRTVSVPLGERSYNVLIGHGLLEETGALCAARFPMTRVLLVTDNNVDAFGYSETVAKSFEKQGILCNRFVFPAGESSKTLYMYEKILNACIASGLDSGGWLIALGGGVVGDLTGFAAATYRRGIRFAQIPTTLLAAVDSSVGGKTGVNLRAGKNLAGAFWQPGLVLCDLDTHKTLPAEEYANGMAECLKYGVLWDEGLFAALEHGGRANESQIARCVELKRDIVANDERDTGARRLLNLGHTLGHAIERASGYAVAHGAAVGLGMVMISRVFCPQICERLCAALAANGLPTRCEYTMQALFAAVEQDKKRAGGDITVVVPQEIGRCELQKLPLSKLKERLEVLP